MFNLEKTRFSPQRVRMYRERCKRIATINVRINAARCSMIDRRRIMTPSAHNGNIKRTARVGVTNDPAGAAHLAAVSRRKRRYFYLRDYTP